MGSIAKSTLRSATSGPLCNPIVDLGFDPANTVLAKLNAPGKFALGLQRIEMTAGVGDAASVVQFAISKQLGRLSIVVGS